MCVTGVVILFTLILVLDLIQHKTTAENANRSPVKDSLTNSISRYEEEIRQMRHTLSEGLEFSVNVASANASQVGIFMGSPLSLAISSSF